MILSMPQNPITLSLPRRLSLRKIYYQPIELAKYATRTLSWGQSSVMDKHLKYLRMTTPYGGSTVTMRGLQERERAASLCSSMLGRNVLFEHLKTLKHTQSVGYALSLPQTPMTLPYGNGTRLPSMDYAELERRVMAQHMRLIC